MIETAYQLPIEERIKNDARLAVRRALKDKTIVRPTHCDKCKRGCVPTAHHDSYDEDKWLTVRWLCSKCHAKADSKRRALERKQVQL